MTTPVEKPVMEDEIKPCPFCGSKKITFSYSGQPAVYFFASCLDCGACGPSKPSLNATGGSFNPEICPAWNQRSHEAAAPVDAQAPEGTDFDVGDLPFALEFWGNLDYENGCKWAHHLLLKYRNELYRLASSPPQSPEPDGDAAGALECCGKMVDVFKETLLKQGDPENTTSPIVFQKCQIEGALGYLETIHAALSSRVEQAGWMPIESAPRDGTKILIYEKGVIYAAVWDHQFESKWEEPEGMKYIGAWTDFAVKSWGYEENQSYEPTHWQPLPAPPSDPALSGENK